MTAVNQSTLLISLDFELFWGMQDIQSLDGYRENISGAKAAVEGMLAMFEKYSIHATWASVGFLFARDLEQLKKYLPSQGLRPTYDNKPCDSYRCLAWMKENPKLGEYFFAPDLIQNIIQKKGQELASHTLSHYYCGERGQTVHQFAADIEAGKRIAAELFGAAVRTLVFPRNQSDPKYVDVLGKLGMLAYRGEEEDWIHSGAGRGVFMRVLRLLDSYIPLTGQGGYVPVKSPEGVLNLKGSRFLRPYSKKLAVLEKLKLRRIKKQMLHAARKGQVFHLWWHPHNFGVKLDYHMSFLEEILDYFQYLSREYGMRSLNMLEAAAEFDGAR